MDFVMCHNSNGISIFADQSESYETITVENQQKMYTNFATFYFHHWSGNSWANANQISPLAWMEWMAYM